MDIEELYNEYLSQSDSTYSCGYDDHSDDGRDYDDQSHDDNFDKYFENYFSLDRL